ncbi:MAG: response regulator transcription factor [Rubrobacteraceae bacterium]|jgi:DNA-binding NarL/FixJ family response regulator|nr:response regulator transcription factor [Rubrobacter sp.]
MVEHTENSSGPSALIWVDCSNTVVALGLTTALKERARVHLGRQVPGPSDEPPTFVIYCVDSTEGLSEGMDRIQGLWPDTSILVFSLHVDLSLAQAALQMGARGFIHAGMTPEQVLRAVEVAVKGELVAPRELLEHLLYQEDPVDLNALTARQQEILGLVVEGLSNAEIAKRLYLSESTVKQHLRAGYKLLGVKNRIEAARLIRNNGR